jgi:acetyl esterase/lipase
MDLKPNVVYQSLSGEDQHLQIFTPASLFPPAPGVPAPFYPVVVYVPGSAWHRQNVWMALDKARYFVSNGYAFVVVEYRPSEIAPFPAQIDDLMSALRFLGKNAALYSLDADRLALWGDSSGGHTVVSAAVNHPEIAKCVVDYFGPTDISLMNYYPSAMDHHGADSPEGFLLGKVNVLENPELAQKTNPLNGISPSKPLPPIMIMHGSKDNVVPFNQSVRLYEKLRECKKEVSFYRLEGAGHGIGGFNSDECLKTTLDWIARYTKSV